MPDRWEAVIGRLERFLAKAEVLLDRYGVSEPLDETVFTKCQAFRWEGKGGAGRLVPVRHPHLPDLDDLVGVDMAKAELVRNTAQFVAGRPANNVLLWGERGTGKSSCVKGLLRLFADHGLRLIEVERGELLSLPRISALVRCVPYRFIVFCDDLSFAAGDATYQELKTLLDGGIEARPGNMLIYATSNRRHLMPETMGDNLREEIHPEEAVSDKLSLADRFGLTLSFHPFSQDTYLAIVDHYADSLGLGTNRDDLRREALRWALYKGQRSGRAARQFIDDLAGRIDA